MGVETKHDLETVADLQRDLAAANQFSDEELAINREGRIAGTQVSRLLRQALHPFASASGVLLGSLMFVVVTYQCLRFSHSLVPTSLLASVPRSLLAFMAVRVSSLAFLMAALITVGALMTLPGGFFKSLGTLLGLVFDLAAGRAHCIEGRTSTSWASEGEQSVKGLLHRDRYWYIVHDEYLPVTIEGYQALRPYSGSECRLYMTPRSKLLLSLEPVKMRPVSSN